MKGGELALVTGLTFLAGAVGVVTYVLWRKSAKLSAVQAIRAKPANATKGTLSDGSIGFLVGTTGGKVSYSAVGSTALPANFGQLTQVNVASGYVISVTGPVGVVSVAGPSTGPALPRAVNLTNLTTVVIST